MNILVFEGYKMRRKTIILQFAILVVLLLTACGELEQPSAPSEEMLEPTPFSTPMVSKRFEVSAELETLTQTIDDTYFNKYGRHLFSDEHWWWDYGVDKNNNDHKALHQYVYWDDRRSYLDPDITVITDEDRGSIISVSVTQSSERFTEQTAQTFVEYFYCVASAFLPDMNDDRLDGLLKELCESENLGYAYPTTLYFTDKIYCYAYFQNGAETIYFGTDLLEKLPEYTASNVNCIEINLNEIEPNEVSSAAEPNSDHQENGIETEVDLSSYFNGLLGTAVFLDRSGKYTVYNKAASELRVSPCSSFHIASTLAALESGVITPSQSTISWDGTKWPFESWNKDLTIMEAFQSSCTWYYKKLIDEIGKESMTNFIEALNYGNCNIGQWEGSGYNTSNGIDGFWLESSLLISPREQVDVMYRIFEGKTEIDKNNIAELKKMMYKEDKDSNFKIYGKTGSGRGGWFVGFFESEADNTYFAVYLNEQEGVNGPKAQEITGNMIQGYFSETIGR